uniref:Integrin alpha FG-GAP repeat containing 2 n=1 Tax=Cyprinus carpio TaxID=7962 RepID=A0A8C2C136_CYPCA
IFPHAICHGDAENDSLNELVVGDTSGKLTCVGMVRMGDVCNKGRVRLSFSLSLLPSTKEGLVLVVGYTDRVVRAFRWEEPSDASDLSSGQMVLLKKWLLEGQGTEQDVDSLSVNPSPEGLPELMVSQPGCGYAILVCSWTQEGAAGPGDENTAATSRDVVLHLTTGRIHNKNVSTHVIGSICRGSKDDSSKGGLFALCTLDGDVFCCLDSSGLVLLIGQLLLFFISCRGCFSLNGGVPGTLKLMDIIDHAHMVVRFQFDDNVNAFCAVFNVKCSLYPGLVFSLLHKLGVYISDTVAVRKLIGDELYKNIAKDNTE